MADRIVVAYFGDRGALTSTVRAAAAKGIEVVAVAFDLGGKTPLSGLRDDALSAGAGRCHALDAREEFAREVIVPALASGSADLEKTVGELAASFVSRSLDTIARLEAAAFVEPEAIDVPWRRRLSRREAFGPAMLALRFANQTPISLNGVTMTPAEILESLETITGEPALGVLHAAYQELPLSPDGIVELRAADGRVDVVSRLVAS